ncbi:acetyl/propionyl/methylcrotonyl-CoA carboxylase subunit alpha [Erythrobacter sp. SCSIO 43205]|uniref:acetyl/propionyl/methylcrotonyl-CoA carboxylase subunit alpha n=1 Tax=Erythrobacter sp. SCSIO 43205 TaxID=2779361 RepID=UPI001CA9E1DE|nr:acetyl/propionyl/methylcrotonyl-CoA carboxylase subunit alpha [Erythrobacter sp. SCSIO 43205]UAB77797.1 acetyl/propionyl/methylcrotonyl-CoA carboxylase subunit alpha [Erythrobacter sp. SCSIO 43205]
MIKKLLIANRGEIACRIMRTAQRMGIATVAVYSDADAKALHTRSADEAVHIGPSPAAESYLVGEKIIAAAKETGAEAIHPGYGFLSENADFARAVIEAGLIWVGPKPESIEAMGLKDAAKERMIAAGVPVTPGYLGEDQSLERLSAEAEKIGYPVLIKAVAGGGGKGMRKVDDPADFAASLESCQREAKASFGNDEVLLEKWITSPRHIEVQVFGDSHGNVVHLFERDCSLQRRHQKVIEEAPAPGMDEATREEICQAAVRAAKAVDYEGAGTIEFIADASEGLRADRIFFMEMNTRLQVEHPVTEEITGVDLVEWQLRVASGEPIPLKQEELSISGWAIEARLYAEDPAKGFLPSTGPAEVFELERRGVRVDSAIEAGGNVSPHYDPMIAKLIAHADNRSEAVELLAGACADSWVWPVKTNAAFLWRALDHEDFQQAKLDTGFIERNLDGLLPPDAIGEDQLVQGAAALTIAAFLDHKPFGWDVSYRREARLDSDADVWRKARGFRANSSQQDTVNLYHQSQHHAVELPVGWEEAGVDFQVLEGGVVVFDDGLAHEFSLRADAGGSASAADGAILAPMPGKVIAVDVAEGDQVTAGQRLMVLEAMKMEHALTAPFDGTVTGLEASQGGQVQVEAVLCVVEPSKVDEGS